MSVLAGTILHDIKDPTDWPEQFSDISSHLFCPLPKSVTSEAKERREFLSIGSWELYQDALNSSLFAVRDEDTIEPAVTDFIDTILSCVMMVKVASSVCASRGHKQAQLSWISVLTQLGVGMSEDIIPLEDAMYLRARTKEKSMVIDVGDVVGRSSFLLATVLNSPPGATDTSEAGMKRDDKEAEICSCNYSTSSKSSVAALDIPLDAHILPGCGKRLHCLVPVVCVAPEHEMEALVTSVVCQRYVLNIGHPVVGVSLSTSGTTAKVILGWAEEKRDECGSAPIIHMTYTLGSDIHPSIGSFDLLDPASMFYFAQFILGLKLYFSSMKECDTLRARNFCWRLDHIGYDHPIRWADSLNGLSKVADWIRGLSAEISDTNDRPATMGPTKPGSSSQSKPSSSSQFLQVPPSQSHRGRSHSRSRPAPALPQQSTGGSSNSSSNHDDSRSRSASAGPTSSYYPASRFAKLSSDNGLVEQWLFERQTTRLFRIDVFGAKSDLEKQVNEMIQEYNDITRFSWPESWSTMSQVPSRDLVHENIRQTLFDGYQNFKTHNSDLPAMEEDVFLSINNHVSALYRAVANAKASHLQAKIEEAKEAALRSSWDELLKAVCCDVNEAVSTFVILEKSIPLPKNKATELGPMFPAERQGQVQRGVLASQLKEVEESENVPPAIGSGVALSYLRTQSLQPSTNLKPEDRSYEPSSAIVDAICYLHYDIQHSASRNSQDSKTREPKAPESTETKKKEKPRGWVWKFIKKVSPKSSMNKVCKGRKPDKLLPPAKTDAGKTGARHATCCMCSFVTDSLALPSPESCRSDFDPSIEILIPYSFTEYKRDRSGERQAFHQAQMYLTFGLEFLAALGIKDEPIWALVTSGTIGTILMAWKSTMKSSKKSSSAVVEYNFIIDQYLRSFDISQPLEALQLMACLRRIYQRGLTLQATLGQRIDPSVVMNPTAIQDRMMPLRSEAKAQAQPLVA